MITVMMGDMIAIKTEIGTTIAITGNFIANRTTMIRNSQYFSNGVR